MPSVARGRTPEAPDLACGGPRSPLTLAARLGGTPDMRDSDATPLDALAAGPHLDASVAERVMVEARPTGGHDHAHAEPLASPGGNWLCGPGHDRGDVCAWVPLPFSTAISVAGRPVEMLEPLGSRFPFADGFVLLAPGRRADHGDRLGPEPTDADEGADPVPQPRSFHVRLGLLSANPDIPAHWTHSRRLCARASPPRSRSASPRRSRAGPRPEAVPRGTRRPPPSPKMSPAERKHT